MWWLVNIEVPNLGEAIAYLSSEVGVHQLFTTDGVPILDKIESYTALDTSIASPVWWTDPEPPVPVAFWEDRT